MIDVELAIRNPLSFCLVRFLFGSLILHQKGTGFLIFWAFFESCGESDATDLSGGDNSAETQGDLRLCRERKSSILFSEYRRFFRRSAACTGH